MDEKDRNYYITGISCMALNNSDIVDKLSIKGSSNKKSKEFSIKNLFKYAKK